MHHLVAPALGAARRQPRRRRHAVVGAPAVAHPASADVVGDRHLEVAVRRALDLLADLACQLGRDALVGVDLEQPVARRRLEPGHAARPLDLPGALEHARGEAPGDRRRPVGAAVEHDDDLVGEAQGLEAVGELRRLVVRHQHRGEFLRHGAKVLIEPAAACKRLPRPAPALKVDEQGGQDPREPRRPDHPPRPDYPRHRLHGQREPDVLDHQRDGEVGG